MIVIFVALVMLQPSGYENWSGKSSLPMVQRLCLDSSSPTEPVRPSIRSNGVISGTIAVMKPSQIYPFPSMFET
jgi:hypothetical protein